MKAGWKTSEFWLTVAAAVGAFVAAPGIALPAAIIKGLVVVGAGAYAIGRSVVKSKNAP